MGVQDDDAAEARPSVRVGVVWSLLSFAGTRTLTFLATLILARLVAPSEFGVLAAVLAYITLLEVVGDLGMKATVIYESERGVTGRVQTAFTLNFAFAAGLTVVAMALSPLVAEFFDAGSQWPLFLIASADLFLRGLGNIHDSLLLRDMEFKRRIVSQLTANVVRGGSTIAMAVAGLGASALVLGYVAGTLAWTLSVWILKPFRPTFQIDRGAVRGIAAYGGWATALEILAAVSQRADVAVIGAALGTRALGLYTIAQRVPELIVGNVTWSLSVVAFPALARRRDSGHESLTSTTLALIRYSALFGLPIAAGLAVLAQPLIVVLFSSTWTEAAAIMPPLAIMYGVVCIVYPLGDTFKALGRQRLMAAVNAVALPLVVGSMLVAAPAGIVAVAWARLGVTAGLGVVWFVLIARTLDLRAAALASALRPALATAAGVAAAALSVRAALPEATIGPLIAGSLAAAAGGAIALRLFAPAEYAELRRIGLSPVVRRVRGAPRPS